MKNHKAKLLLPLTIITGVVAAIGGAVLFAKNKTVQKFVKDSSYKLLDTLKSGFQSVDEKLTEAKKTNKDDKFVEFFSKAVGDINDKLSKTTKKDLTGSLNNAAGKINEILEKFEEIKEKTIDPKVKEAVENIKQLKEKISQK